MKKFTILTLALALALSGFAQENTKDGEVNMMSKRGEYILPAQGDFALGINALPIVKYFGNMFNGNLGNTASFDAFTSFDLTNSTTTPLLYGKYYLTDKTAIRGGLQIGINNSVTCNDVTMNQLIPDSKVKVTDTHSNTTTILGIGADYLFFRGKGRVQGFYGGGLYLNYATTKDSYTYGNLITTEFTSPIYTDFTTMTTVAGSSRILANRGRTSFGATIRGIVGVEYFIAPKVSIGGEFCLGVYAGVTSRGTSTIERWNGLEREVEDVQNDDRYRAFGLANASSGSIFMMFHF